MLEFTLIVAGFASAAVCALRAHSQPAVISGSIGAILYVMFLARIRRAHFSWDANTLALFGLPLFSYLLLRSVRFHQHGNIEWKGRKYSGSLSKNQLSKDAFIPSEARNPDFIGH